MLVWWERPPGRDQAYRGQEADPTRKILLVLNEKWNKYSTEMRANKRRTEQPSVTGNAKADTLGGSFDTPRLARHSANRQIN